MARFFSFSRLRLAVTAGLLIAAPFAMAGGPDVSWSVSVGTGYPAPVYVQPAPPVVYAPAPVYVRPQPVYVQPATVIQYAPPAYWGPPGHWKHENRNHGHGPRGHYRY